MLGPTELGFLTQLHKTGVLDDSSEESNAPACLRRSPPTTPTEQPPVRTAHPFLPITSPLSCAPRVSPVRCTSGAILSLRYVLSESLMKRDRMTTMGIYCRRLRCCLNNL